METRDVRVLIVDDTVVYRRILTDTVERIPGASVAATAPHGELALKKMEQTRVDLVLLDVEMPVMNGLETLKHIKQRYPEVGVIMVSGVDKNAASITIEALEEGALDFVPKPTGSDPEESRKILFDQLSNLFRIETTRFALGTSPTPDKAAREKPVEKMAPMPKSVRERGVSPVTGRSAGRIDIVAIGVSTGGPKALAELVPKLPPDLGVPVVIVQHMPPVFTASLASSLSRRAQLPVREARDGESIEANTVLLAPGGKHMVVRRNQLRGDGGAGRFIGLNENPPENNCRPSVDVLFRSVSTHYGQHVLAVIMTGMGDDGCRGVQTMKRKGCYSLTQNEKSCVVYGMPRAIDEAGLSDERLSLDALATRIVELTGRVGTRQ